MDVPLAVMLTGLAVRFTVCGTGAVVPLPLKVTLAVASSGSLEGMDKVAVWLPLDVGVKATSRVALSLGARLCPEQLSLTIKNWSALGPTIETLSLTVRLAVPTLDTNTVQFALDEPTGIEPKSIEEGLTIMSGTVSV